MRTVGRFASGLVVGCVLFVWSFILAGAGQGSSVPLASAAPLFFVNIDAFAKLGLWGLLLMLLGTGFLWAIYFGAFPAINSLAVRMLLVVFVACVHVGTAVWQLTKDFLLSDSFKRFPVLTGGYFILFLLTLLSLGALTWVGSERRFSPASS